MAKCIDFKNPTKTYKSRESMNRGIDKYPFLADAGYITGHTDDGRLYPIFIWSRLPKDIQHNLGLLPHLGFCVVN